MHILDRPRHEDLVREVREAGARIQFISTATWPGRSPRPPGQRRRHAHRIGGTPEGIITAAALKCMDGEIQTRLWPKDDAERQQTLDAGHDVSRC
ncbi:fructose-bisphosphatase class II [Saccharopolyspora gregorii]|uniref:Fructose-1,6-bisphosphatase class 2 n=1 Tax=Saccharopolyspora gregorii TaxID=33914 RepID=A0ABP6RKT3_9PSEU